MADIVGSLFGISPDIIRAQQAKDREAQAQFMAQNAPAGYGNIVYGASKLGQNIGGAIQGLLGIEDPQLTKAKNIDSVLQQVQSELGPEGISDPTQLYPKLAKKLSDLGYGNEATQVSLVGQKEIQDWNTKQATIKQKQFDLQQDQEAKLALQELNKTTALEGRTPTTEEIISVLSDKLPAEKLAPLLQTSADKAAYRQTMLDQAKIQADARVQAAQDRNASAKEMEAIRQENRIALAKIEATLKVDKPLTGREARYADNVAIAGNEAIAGINNIINLPKTVTGGFWGAGLPKMQTGKGLFEAPIGALKNSMTKETTQRYNAEIKNIGKYYSTLRNGGLAATNDDINAFEDQFRINENDKPLTALTKLAQMRQTFERAAEIKILSANTPKEQRGLWKDWLDQVKTAIPITVNDINQIANEKDKTKTFAAVLAETKAKSDQIKNTPPQEAIDELKSNPKLANKFDEVFGQGASAKYLKE